MQTNTETHTEDTVYDSYDEAGLQISEERS